MYCRTKYERGKTVRGTTKLSACVFRVAIRYGRARTLCAVSRRRFRVVSEPVADADFSLAGVQSSTRPSSVSSEMREFVSTYTIVKKKSNNNNKKKNCKNFTRPRAYTFPGHVFPRRDLYPAPAARRLSVFLSRRRLVPVVCINT